MASQFVDNAAFTLTGLLQGIAERIRIVLLRLGQSRSAASAFIESFSPPSSGVRLCFPWSDVRFGMIHIVSCLPDIKPE